MLRDKYCILSFPNKDKHYVLRTSDSDEEILLKVDGVEINSSLVSITDSYTEATQIYKNIRE
jgi:hypothetical protein